eukprot:jgi/Undpi1/10147/HiC_scaffold_28.g12601.m1
MGYPGNLQVPQEIMRPDYAKDGIPKAKSPMLPWVIEVKKEEDIVGMREAGRVAREVLDLAGEAVKVGATTDDVGRVCHNATVERGAYPSPLNYHGFPKSLEEGMMINVDVTVFYKGYHGDCSEMFMVGEVDQASKGLIEVCFLHFYFCCGHGIGMMFHTNPNILHYKNNESNGIMKAGHTFTIEPMIFEGTAKNVMWPDKWTAATSNGRRTAQFEHTFLMTEDGAVPLTAKLDTSPRQFWEK